jgi:hypothetical protein
VALAVVVSVAIGACGTSDKQAAQTSPRESGTGTDGGPFLTTGPDLLHPDPTKLGDAAIAACGGLGRVATCKACLQKSCCDAATACAKNSACTQNAACIQACEGSAGDAGRTCTQACANKYFAAAGAAYNGLVVCMNQSCATECPFTAP